jgi:hypothetical protein
LFAFAFAKIRLNADLRDEELNGSLKFKNETELTYDLKWAAWKWLYSEAGCRVIGFEVRLEGPGGRIADVVGVDGKNRVYIVEVKSSRSDLMKDNRTRRDRERLSEDIRGLEDAARFARELALVASDTGSAASLLARESQNTASAKVKAAERRLVSFSIKFHDAAYLRAADFHYLMAPHGLVWPSELPPFWGLLNGRGEQLVPAPPKQVRRVTPHVLRAIGKANTRDLMKACQPEPPVSKKAPAE